MKRNREVLKPEIRLKNEKENIQRGVSNDLIVGSTLDNILEQYLAK